MLLIIGLGNPGEKYQKNRHNIGFTFLETLKEKEGFPDFRFDKKFNAEISQKNDIILSKPLTFMNKSGLSIFKLANYYNIETENIVVAHDDIDIIFGKIKIDKERSSAGHNGVKSVINHLGTNNFWRVRIGIGKEEKVKALDIALKNFEKAELESVKEAIDRLLEEIPKMILKGFEKKSI